MAFCKACGQEIGTAGFCPKCGASQGTVATPVTVAAPSSDGLAENVAGLLCYVLGFLTGIIFLLIDKRPFVKFHAAQSIVVFGAIFVLRIGLSLMAGMTGGLLGYGTFGLLSIGLSLLTLVLWVLLMLKAYQHELFKLPIAAPIAEGIANK
jgi:uncharacterized membrane protein